MSRRNEPCAWTGRLLVSLAMATVEGSSVRQGPILDVVARYRDYLLQGCESQVQPQGTERHEAAQNRRAWRGRKASPGLLKGSRRSEKERRNPLAASAAAPRRPRARLGGRVTNTHAPAVLAAKASWQAMFMAGGLLYSQSVSFAGL